MKQLFKKQKRKRNHNRMMTLTILAIFQNLIQISIFFYDRFYAGIRWTTYQALFPALSLFLYLRVMGKNFGSVYKHKIVEQQSISEMYWSNRLMLLISIPFAIFPYITILLAVCYYFEFESNFLKDEGFLSEEYFEMHADNSFWACIIGTIFFLISVLIIGAFMYYQKR